MGTKYWIVLAAVAISMAAATPAAADGCAQIHEAGDILAPGCFRVTRDILTFGTPAITVNVAGDQTVVIDLCGHTLTQASTSMPVVLILSASRVVIKNGTFEGGNFGLESTSSPVNLDVDGLNFNSSFNAGIRVDGGGAINVVRTNFEFIGMHGMDVTGSQSIKVRSSDFSNLGGSGINSVGNEEFVFDDLRIESVTQTGVHADGTGASNPSAKGSDTDVVDAGTGYTFVGQEAWKAQNLTARSTTGDAIVVVDSTGGYGEWLQFADVGEDGLDFVNSSDNTVRKVRGSAITGVGLRLDATSSDNRVVEADISDAQLDGVLILGTRNWVERSLSHEPLGCPFHIGASGADNVLRLLGGMRSAGPCTCTGTQTGSVCDDGTNNLINELIL